MDPRKVLLIGGNGFVGGWVASRLAEDRIAAVVPMRSQAQLRWLDAAKNAAFPQADVHDPIALADIMRGVDAVINLVGILHDRDTSAPFGRRFAAAHVELPKKIVAAMRQTGVRRLAHISALRADAGAPSAYLRSKAAGEAVLLEAACDLDVTIFRPSVIFGANDVFLNRFAALLRVFPVLPVGGAEALFQPVYAGDVAGAIVDALARPETFGKIYELGGPQVYTLRQLLAYTARLIGKRRSIIALPGPLARLQAHLLGLLPNPPMSPDNLRSMTLESVVDGRHNYPGWQPTALESVVPGYLAR